MRINTGIAMHGIPPRGVASAPIHSIWNGVIDWDENFKKINLPYDLKEEIPKHFSTHLFLVFDCPAFNLTLEVNLNMGPYGVKINRELPEITITRFEAVLDDFFKRYLLLGE